MKKKNGRDITGWLCIQSQQKRAGQKPRVSEVVASFLTKSIWPDEACLISAFRPKTVIEGSEVEGEASLVDHPL
jgi:hypothetical protein